MISFDRRVKNFKRAFGRYWVVAFGGIVRRMPLAVSRTLLGLSWAPVFALLKRHRKVARDGLAIAFGNEKSPAERERILRRCFFNVGVSLVESIYYDMHRASLRRKVSFEGIEHLRGALALGKGAVIVTAHFGNFPLMIVSLAEHGFPLNVIIRQARDPKMQQYFNANMDHAGVGYIFSRPRRACLLGAVNILKKNEALMILADQHFGAGGGVETEFLGRPAMTAPGPVVFARRTGAAMIPMFITRNDDGSHVIHVEPPLEPETAGDEQEAVRLSVEKMNRVIERYIRRYPHEWAWMHRRWKSE